MTEILEVTTLRPAAGLTAAAGISGEMADSPVHATIDHTTVDWNLTTVLHRVDGN